jgi:hypothetical protein
MRDYELVALLFSFYACYVQHWIMRWYNCIQLRDTFVVYIFLLCCCMVSTFYKFLVSKLQTFAEPCLPSCLYNASRHRHRIDTSFISFSLFAIGFLLTRAANGVNNWLRIYYSTRLHFTIPRKCQYMTVRFRKESISSSLPRFIGLWRRPRRFCQ